VFLKYFYIDIKKGLLYNQSVYTFKGAFFMADKIFDYIIHGGDYNPDH